MLDPQRIGLNAESVGFLTRTKQKVDWDSFKQALQTDDSRVAEVRAEKETPVDELHVMGGQRFGMEGNANLKINARQERQMNGYPLRSFSADAPSIILPDKYGGLPLYTANQVEYRDFVSSYTAPLSAVLENDTILLGREGYSVTNESASQPFQDVGFEHNLHKSKAAIDYNEMQMRQKQWLQHQSRAAKSKRGSFVYAMRHESRGMGDGIFIGADGKPMTQVQDESGGDFAAGAMYGKADVTAYREANALRKREMLSGGFGRPDADNLSVNPDVSSRSIGQNIVKGRRQSIRSYGTPTRRISIGGDSGFDSRQSAVTVADAIQNKPDFGRHDRSNLAQTMNPLGDQTVGRANDTGMQAMALTPQALFTPQKGNNYRSSFIPGSHTPAGVSSVFQTAYTPSRETAAQQMKSRTFYQKNSASAAYRALRK